MFVTEAVFRNFRHALSCRARKSGAF